ncbi:3648_t:CDS:2 [Funneliformis geosporum]|nr:3648_t:CDS:2 [Funneliformis geosporum]
MLSATYARLSYVSQRKLKRKGQGEISEAGEITLSAPRPNRSMNNYNGTQTRQATSIGQRFLEIKPEIFINYVFGASIIACSSEDLCALRQKNNHNLLPRDQEHFNNTYGITYINPLLIDHSGMVVLFLNGRGVMFKLSEMTKDMHINKMEDLAKYLYHPEMVCAIMEDTGELVPRVQLKRRVKEKRAKEQLEKEKLAKEKKLAKDKLAKQKD